MRGVNSLKVFPFHSLYLFEWIQRCFIKEFYEDFNFNEISITLLGYRRRGGGVEIITVVEYLVI